MSSHATTTAAAASAAALSVQPRHIGIPWTVPVHLDLAEPAVKLEALKKLLVETTTIYDELMRVTAETRAQQGGRWKNPLLYKTKLCDHIRQSGACHFGDNCWYAHDEGELRHVVRLDQVPPLLNHIRATIVELESEVTAQHAAMAASTAIINLSQDSGYDSTLNSQQHQQTMIMGDFDWPDRRSNIGPEKNWHTEEVIEKRRSI